VSAEELILRAVVASNGDRERAAALAKQVTVGIVTALPEERAAMLAMFEETYPWSFPGQGAGLTFMGPIASGNILLKDPVSRDRLRDQHGVKAVEMEGSGIADATWEHGVGYLVVRGICDYCDSNKNDEWHVYAAIVAAAYARAVIERMAGGEKKESAPPPPIKTPEVPFEEPEQPTNYAKAWRYSRLFLVAAIVLGLFGLGWDTLEHWKVARTVGDGLQFVVVVLVFLDVVFDGEMNPGDERSKDFVEPFRSYWTRLWLLWCVFYLTHVVRGVYEIMNPPDLDSHWTAWWSVVTNFFTNVQSTTLLILFWMMLRPILHERYRRLKKLWGWLAAVYYIVFAMVQVVLLFVYKNDYDSIRMVDLIMALPTGIAAATFMGMFIGRLESAFLVVHPVELALLYAYAATQPFFPMLRALGGNSPNKENVILELSLKSLACALKLGLYSSSAGKSRPAGSRSTCCNSRRCVTGCRRTGKRSDESNKDELLPPDGSEPRDWARNVFSTMSTSLPRARRVGWPRARMTEPGRSFLSPYCGHVFEVGRRLSPSGSKEDFAQRPQRTAKHTSRALRSFAVFARPLSCIP
jgi:hypothetical protein